MRAIFRLIMRPQMFNSWWQQDVAAHLQQFYADYKAGKPICRVMVRARPGRPPPRNATASLLVTKGVTPAVWAPTLIAMVTLWHRPQRIVDLWLMLVMWIRLFDIGLAVVSVLGGRTPRSIMLF